jgi:hypothetical protein
MMAKKITRARDKTTEALVDSFQRELAPLIV